MQQRKALRQAARLALLNNTRAIARVEASRVNPLSQRPSAAGGTNELPAICIYTRTTKSEIFDESPRRYRHEVELAVEAVTSVSAETDIDDDLDDFEQEIHAALLVDDTLGGVVDDLIATGSTNVIDGSGDRLLAATVVTYTAIIFTNAPIDGTLSLPDFDGVDTGYNLDGAQPDPADRAVTHIEGLST